MNRFAGKFSFYYNDYKLIFFDSRVGFVHKTKTTFTLPDKKKTVLPLPEEASLFLAYERIEGWVVLQTYKEGKFIAFGGENNAEIIPTSESGNPYYPVPVHVPYFDLSLIRAGRADGSWKTRLAFQRPGAVDKSTAELRSRYPDPKDLDDTDPRGVTNLTTSNARFPPSIFTFVQHADGVKDMTAGMKTVDRFDFRSAGKARVDLSGEDLSSVIFGRSNFTGAIVKGTKFNTAKFAGACFTAANLDGADFTGALLDPVDFSHAASMDGTILTGVTGKSCNFSYCDLRKAVSSTALAIDSPESAPARFSHAKMKYPLLGPVWKYRHLDFLVLEGLPTTPIPDLDARNAVMTGMELGKLSASLAKFDNATMHAVGFTLAKLDGATFDGARLEGVNLPDGSALAPANFAGADLAGASFQNANVTGVSFTKSILTEAKFTSATIRFAKFISAFMQAVDFSAVEQKLMDNVILTGAFLVGSKFTGADLSNAVLEYAYLHGADFSNAQLGRASLAMAGVAMASGELTVTLDDFTFKVSYDKTIIDPAASTSDATRCPNGDLGPCTGNKLIAPDFPDVWPRPKGAPWLPESDVPDFAEE